MIWSGVDNWLAKPAAQSAGQEVARRMYQAARGSKLLGGFGQSDFSADSELISSLGLLRSRSRQLVRDSSYAKRAKVIVVNNVVGAGIGMQAQVMTSRDGLNERINSDIEEAWTEWCEADSCHTGGVLHFSDFERAAMGEVFETGEVFIRKHFQKFGDSDVPLALELIEPERLADKFTTASPPVPITNGAALRMGVELDSFGRPLAYWIWNFHPGEFNGYLPVINKVERVPADQIIHLKLVDRWPQTRGEPWLHACIRKLNDMDGYSEAELVAARGAACYLATIETADPTEPMGVPQPDGTQNFDLEPGSVQKLLSGEKLNFVTPNRPNTAFDPFMRAMLREMAAGSSVSYESLSRDYSQSNYSSSRLGLLDDRDLWKMLQQWFIRAFRTGLHETWLQQAVLARAIPSISLEAYGTSPDRFGDAVSFKPRGWSWVDPTKEVEAFEKAVRCGFTTVSSVIAQTADGRDVEDIVTERDRELKMFAAKGIVLDTDPAVVPAISAARPNPQTVQGEPSTSAPPEPSTTPPARLAAVGGQR
jgi:lambda family phage portal protein